jgi:hypothetical protein
MIDSLLPEGQDFFCSELSLELGEPLYGSAVTVGVWFLLEYIGPWYAKATENNNLPRPVRAWLNEQLALVDNGRLQFIKQQMRIDAEGISFFVAVNRETDPTLYQFQLDNYEDLLALDVAAMVAGNATYDDFICPDPLFLVCTNGKRDRCCALHGLALYNTVVERVGNGAWQTTHLAGHRFAATMLAFPGGVNYGRLAPDHVEPLLAAHQQGHIYLEKLRGRTCYTPVAQVADYFLRRQTGRLALSDFHHLATEALADGAWLVHFTAPATGEIHTIRLAQDEPLHLYASCGKPQPKPVPRYRFIAHQTRQP